MPRVRIKTPTLPLTPAVKALKKWRKLNKLSQRQAFDAMASRGFDVSLGTIRAYEQGVITPGKFVGPALLKFLEDNPVITDAPKYGRWAKIPDQDIRQIRKMRKNGDNLEKIAAAFDIDQSTVSRICSKDPKQRRRAKAAVISS
jgi:hypothetical protein